MGERGNIVDDLSDLTINESYPSGSYEHIVPLSIFKRAKKIKGDITKAGIRSSLVKISTSAAKTLNLKTNQIARIATADGRKVYDCTICIVPDEYNTDKENGLKDNEVFLSFFLKREFTDQDECLLIIPKTWIVLEPTVQLATKIRERNITLGKDLYDELSALNTKYIEIRHLATGATMIKPFSQVIYDSAMGNSKIRLTYYQRVILNLEIGNLNNDETLNDKIERVNYSLDRYIEERKLKVEESAKKGKKSLLYLKIKNSELPDLVKKLAIGKTITDDEWNKYKILSINDINASKPVDNDEDREYEIKVTGKFSGTNIEIDVVKPEYKNLQIVPIFSDYKRKIGWKEILSDSFVGSSNLCLSAVRPYQVDDDRDVVRLSKDNMTLLGIEETDRVRIEYKGKMIHATVMSIDSPENMKEQNILFSEADLDTIIGIPSPLRRNLAIHDVETEVFVYRDTEFVFKKNINIHLLPILALIFTVFQIDMDLKYQIMTCIVMTPVIMFSALSQERQKVKELNKENPEKNGKRVKRKNRHLV